jgi:RNA polymerase sigma-70 factor (ECF subfamily)
MALVQPRHASPRDTLLAERCAEGRAAHPRLALDEATFAAYLDARATDDAALRRLHAADLYLACACARGEPEALVVFEAQIVDKLAPALARAGAASLVDEVKQIVRERLLLGAAGKGPRIADYAGEGALLTWVRVVALRAAATLRRGAQRSRAREDEALLDAPLALDSPDLLHLRRRYADDFKAAFELGVAELTPRDRNLLRQHLIDRLTIDDLGALYRVNRVTASRWLSHAREEVARATRKALVARLRLSPPELESILRLVRSDLDLSIDRVLRRA